MKQMKIIRVQETFHGRQYKTHVFCLPRLLVLCIILYFVLFITILPVYAYDAYYANFEKPAQNYASAGHSAEPVQAATGSGEPAQASDQPEPEFTEFEELNGKTIGMITGAPFEELVKSKIPDVADILYFGSVADMVEGLKSRKIDALFLNNAVLELAANQDRSIAVFPKTLGEAVFGYAFRKGSSERQKWQEARDNITEEEIQELWGKWIGADDSVKFVPDQDWPGTNGTVQVAACDTMPPMSYRSANGSLIGFDIDIILHMARKLDVHVDFIGMDFSSVMSSVESGKALFGTGSIVASDERREIVDFVDYYPAFYVLGVRSAENTETGAAFGSGLKSSFYRTFIKENRYRMILSGLESTVLTSALSGLFGLILAYGLVFLRHKNNRVTNSLINAYSSLISGIPAVVILMVFYYIVFGRAAIPALLVAVVGFSLIFAARAYGVMWNTIESIDPGQREAALALGYSEARAFRELILPQARPGFRPLLLAQFVALVKETSIAGYITVLELTRAGDLIRSRTMQAFFPLISIALIYFILIRFLEQAAGLLEKIHERRREKRTIKGVDA